MRAGNRAGGGELAYVGLGANLGDPVRQLRTALSALCALPRCWLLRRSSLYRTPPLGPPGQPDYVNATALLETDLTPLELLDALQGIERSRGRRRDGERWGPRTLDLDLLLFGSRIMAEARLSLPHPRMHRRAFVLVPLAEIAPADLVLPGAGVLRDLLRDCDREGITLVPGSVPWQNADSKQGVGPRMSRSHD